MRSLWKMDAYSCSPLVTMALLVPVQLDPEFGCIYEGLRAIMRYVRQPRAAAELRRRFYTDPLFPVDGPTARPKTLADASVLGRHIYTLINGEFCEGNWLHQLRDEWRNFLWGRVARERSHHYAGAQQVDRKRTMRWYNMLQEIADQEEGEGDGSQVSEARAQMGVLRTILAGGLMTPDRALRHRRKQGEHMCRCGAERESVEHVSWRCEQYQEYRSQLSTQLSCSIDELPVCMQYAAVVPTDCLLTDEEIFAIQSYLVKVWQHHIKQWQAGEDLVVIPREINEQQVIRGEDVEENGHLLAARSNGPGMWCKRCGKYTSMLKHVRLKITKTPCSSPNGWTQEGHNMAEKSFGPIGKENSTPNITGGDMFYNGTGSLANRSALRMRGGFVV